VIIVAVGSGTRGQARYRLEQGWRATRSDDSDSPSATEPTLTLSSTSAEHDLRACYLGDGERAIFVMNGDSPCKRAQNEIRFPPYSDDRGLMK